jgi:hypothetical protein
MSPSGAEPDILPLSIKVSEVPTRDSCTAAKGGEVDWLAVEDEGLRMLARRSHVSLRRQTFRFQCTRTRRREILAPKRGLLGVQLPLQSRRGPDSDIFLPRSRNPGIKPGDDC